MSGNSLGVLPSGAWAGAERSGGERSEPQCSGSPATNKHFHSIFAACFEVNPAFLVANVGAAAEAEHDANLADYAAHAQAFLEQAGGTQDSDSRAWHLMMAGAARGEALAYAEFFGLKPPQLPDVPPDELADKKRQKLRRDAQQAGETLGKARRAWNAPVPKILQ